MLSRASGLVAVALLAASCTATNSAPPPPPSSSTTTTASPPTNPTTTSSTTSTTTTTTTTLPPPFQPVIPARGLRYGWVLHTADAAGAAIYGDGYAPVVDASIPEPRLKTVADDGAGGLVYLDADFNLWWIRAGVLYPILVAKGFSSFIGVAPGTRTLVYMSEENPAYLDLFSGEPADTPPPEADPWGGGGFETALIRAAQGRTAFIDYPEAESDDESLTDLGPADLVIAGGEGEELLRLTVGTAAAPFAVLHDFDGRRVLISREPLEPARPPATLFVLDLECPECTQAGFADGASADLMGTLAIESGEVLPPDLDECAGVDADAELPEQDLAPAVAATRRALFAAAIACDFIALEQLAGSEVTPVVGHAAVRPGWRGAASARPSLAADIVTGLSGTGRLTVDGDHRWPGWLGQGWADLTPAEQEALEDEFGDGCTDFDTFAECYDANGDEFALSTFIITIGATGLLRYVGIALS